MDMVCEKNADVTFDFSRDAIQLRTRRRLAQARGTTLGADNGIGLAAALAIADDPEVVHGPLEILITVDEETGLTGATQLDASMVKGRRLLNLDTEELDAIYIGCSGGGNSDPHAPRDARRAPGRCEVRSRCTRPACGAGTRAWRSFCSAATRSGAWLACLRAAPGGRVAWRRIEGGNAHNAIPREAFAMCAVPASGADAFAQRWSGGAAIAGELGVADPGSRSRWRQRTAR